MSIKTYSGWVSEVVLLNVDSASIATGQIPLRIPTTNITWDNNEFPDGWAGNTPTSNIPGGYVVKYDIYYALSGWWKFPITQVPPTIIYLWDYYDLSNLRVDYIPVNYYPDVNPNWSYGPPVLFGPIPSDYLQKSPTGQKPFVIPNSQGINIPGSVSINVPRDGPFSDIRSFTFQVLLRITVSRDCSTNIEAPICKEICAANPRSDACFTAYAGYCLNPDNPERIATSTCYNYLVSFVNNGGRSALIDDQAIRYCEKKYSGLQQFYDATAGKDPVDFNICACNIKSREADDPKATVLYQNYFDSVVNQFPGFNTLGQKEKCVFSPCASSDIGYAGMPPNGCNVPACVAIAQINNNGTINGNVTIDQNISGCGQYTDDSVSPWVVAVVVIVLVLILVLLFLILYYGSPSPPKNNTPKVTKNPAGI